MIFAPHPRSPVDTCTGLMGVKVASWMKVKKNSFSSFFGLRSRNSASATFLQVVRPTYGESGTPSNHIPRPDHQIPYFPIFLKRCEESEV